jgi:hypothetical protein
MSHKRFLLSAFCFLLSAFCLLPLLLPASCSCLLPPDLVRQVRLELTIPCLRGRCLDPIGLLTQVICDFQLSLLAGLTRLELAISASTVQRSDPTKLQPQYHASTTSLKSAIENRHWIWVGRRELNPHWPQSQCGALPLSYSPHKKGDQDSNVTGTFSGCSHDQHSHEAWQGVWDLNPRIS